MYIHVDEDLLALMRTIESQSGYTGPALADNLVGVDALLVGQFVSSWTTTNLLFVEAEQEASIKQLQDMWVIATDVAYRTKKIGTSTWVYGDEIAIDNFEKHAWSSLDVLTWVSVWAKSMTDGSHNVWFLSRGQGGGPNPLVAQLGKKLEYTMALSHLANEKSAGTIIMQFSPQTIHPTTNEFSPELAAIQRDDALLYIEFQDIIGALGVDDAQIATFLPLIMAQYNPALARLLSQEDYDQILQVLHDNIAVSLHVNTWGGVWLWAWITFRHPQALALAQVMKPMFRGLIDTFLGSGAIDEQTTDAWFTLSVAIPWLEAMLWSDPLVSFVTLPEDIWSVMSILMHPQSVLGNGIPQLTYSPKSIATFHVDTQAMEKLQNSVSPNSLNGLAAGQYFTQWVIKGHIVLDEENQQVRLLYQVVPRK